VTRAIVAAHRGVATGAAENTIDAFTNAISVGADMVEFDVRRTRDGALIAFHDADVNGAPVGSLTRDDIAAVTGVRPPLLTEVLRFNTSQFEVDGPVAQKAWLAKTAHDLGFTYRDADGHAIEAGAESGHGRALLERQQIGHFLAVPCALCEYE